MTFTKAQRIKGLKKQLANLGEEVDDETEPTAAAQDGEISVSLEGMGDW